MNLSMIFDVAAQDYDATRKKYISCFDDFMVLQSVKYLLLLMLVLRYLILVREQAYFHLW